MPVKSKVKILQNFVAYPEYMNFIKIGGTGGGRVYLSPPFLADLLPLCQPGADYAHRGILKPSAAD